MCDIDYESPCQSREWRRARKSHDCYSCGEQIRSGDLYHYTSGIWDGAPDSFKHCARCWKIVEALWADGAASVDYSLSCGESWEDAREGKEPVHLAFMTKDEAQIYATRAKEKVA